MEKKRDKKKVFQCPLCQKGLEIKISKKQKPYCVCLDCGIQLFIRGKQGISRLKKKTGFELDSFDVYESNRGTKTLAQLKAELREVNRAIEEDFLEDYPELREKRGDLISKIETLEGESSEGLPW